MCVLARSRKTKTYRCQVRLKSVKKKKKRSLFVFLFFFKNLELWRWWGAEWEKTPETRNCFSSAVPKRYILRMRNVMKNILYRSRGTRVKITSTRV